MTGKFDDPYGPGGEGPGSTTTTLLEGLLGLDSAAWQRLVRLYAPLIYRCARNLGVPAQDVADIGQAVFLNVATGIRDFRRDRDKTTFRGWIWRITQRRVHDYFRDRERGIQAVGGEQGADHLRRFLVEPEEDDPDADQFGDLFLRALDQVLGEFEPRTREAFVATTIEGRPTQEVAEALGMTINAVQIARSRVLRRLREELGDTQS